MKRIFVFAVLAGAFAVPVEHGPGPDGRRGHRAAQRARIQPSERSALGGLASGSAERRAERASGAAAAAAQTAAQRHGCRSASRRCSGSRCRPGRWSLSSGGIAGQGVIAQQGVAGQGGSPAGRAGTGRRRQAVAGQAASARRASLAQGVVARGQTVVGMQQSFHSQMQRHFLVQQAFHHCMFFSEFQPHVIRPVARPWSALPGPFFGPVAGDLELISVGMVADGIADKGPIYRVTFKNHSAIASRHFRVSLIATLGRLEPTSPVVSVNIPEIAPGAIANIEVQLPLGVMTLGGQPAGPFSQLIAVDGQLWRAVRDEQAQQRADADPHRHRPDHDDDGRPGRCRRCSGCRCGHRSGCCAVAPAAAAPAAGAPAAAAPAARLPLPRSLPLRRATASWTRSTWIRSPALRNCSTNSPCRQSPPTSMSGHNVQGGPIHFGPPCLFLSLVIGHLSLVS